MGVLFCRCRGKHLAFPYELSFLVASGLRRLMKACTMPDLVI